MFDGVPHATGVTGAPVLLGTVAHLECELHAVLDGGDHALVLGHVLRAVSAPHRRPLVVHRRELTSVADVSGASRPPLTVVRPDGRPRGG
jgi:flavin reductase (DIM6/NTAB) family NADH-FMN oxidoreductase RutF